MNDTSLTKSALKLTLEGALKVVAAAQEKARALKLHVTIAVVDEAGHLLCLQRHDEALYPSVEIAQVKARTAVALGAPSAVVSAIVSTEYIADLAQFGGLTALPGGIPLFVNGQKVGAIGTSGASIEEDVTVSEAGAKALSAQK